MFYLSIYICLSNHMEIFFLVVPSMFVTAKVTCEGFHRVNCSSTGSTNTKYDSTLNHSI